MVVDDNVDSAKTMALLVTKLFGHDVQTAHEGHAAVSVARTFRPNVVLLDLGLPGLSGYEVAEALRQDGCCRGAVIAAITGYCRDEDRQRTREAGFDFHLVKPVTPEVLKTLFASPKLT
ncbi:MAG: response regulator [Planctomycetia bacterium]|nr:response regulator [Planctomycetia bacterium]